MASPAIVGRTVGCRRWTAGVSPRFALYDVPAIAVREAGCWAEDCGRVARVRAMHPSGPIMAYPRNAVRAVGCWAEEGRRIAQVAPPKPHPSGPSGRPRQCRPGSRQPGKAGYSPVRRCGLELWDDTRPFAFRPAEDGLRALLLRFPSE